MHSTEISQNNSRPDPHDSPWVRLAVLLAILAFVMISTMVGHQSVGQVSAISTIIMALFATWRGGGGA